MPVLNRGVALGLAYVSPPFFSPPPPPHSCPREMRCSMRSLREASSLLATFAANSARSVQPRRRAATRLFPCDAAHIRFSRSCYIREESFNGEQKRPINGALYPTTGLLVRPWSCSSPTRVRSTQPPLGRVLYVRDRIASSESSTRDTVTLLRFRLSLVVRRADTRGKGPGRGMNFQRLAGAALLFRFSLGRNSLGSRH